MSGVSKVYQSVSNAMCRKRSNHKGLRAFRPGFDSPRSHCTKSRKVLQKDLTGLFLPVFRQSRIIEMMIDSCV